MNNRSFEKIGKGGSNIVYETKKNSENGLVMKFNFNSFEVVFNSILGRIDEKKLASIREAIEKRDDKVLAGLGEIDDKTLVSKIINFYNDEGKENIDDIVNHIKDYVLSTDRALGLYEKEVKNEIDSYSNLVKFFKKENLLGQKIFNLDSSNVKDVLNSEITNDVLNNLITSRKIDNFKQEDAEKIKSFFIEKKVSIPVIVQEKFDFKDRENVFEFHSGIPRNDTFKKIFNEGLIKKDYTNTTHELSRTLKDNKIYQLLEKDPSSKEVVCDFLHRAIEYTKNTHEFIDFFGGNNIFFYKEDDSYTYKLLDPIVHISDYSEDSNFKNDSFEDFLKKDGRHIRHFYVYIKTINDLAKELGMKERLKPEDFFGSKINGVEEDINNFIK